MRTNGFQVTEEFYTVINGETNPAVTERVVGPLLPPGYPQPVLFSSETKEVLLASLNTNQNCYLNGRLFRVDLGFRTFYVTPSAPFGTNVFTPERALQFGMRAFPQDQGEAYPLAESRGRTFAPSPYGFVERALSGLGAGAPGVMVDLEPLGFASESRMFPGKPALSIPALRHNLWVRILDMRSRTGQ